MNSPASSEYEECLPFPTAKPTPRRDVVKNKGGNVRINHLLLQTTPASIPLNLSITARVGISQISPGQNHFT